ncbi:hypothetical protein C8J56DRAFT_1046126 [Mycena floridula]|nr:hypothetical protein C8J56DRAFT_1046126 [Mycena floridula]
MALCGDSKCTEIVMPKNLKFCGGCRILAYCSPACQKAGWKDHQEDCKSLAQTLQRNREITRADFIHPEAIDMLYFERICRRDAAALALPQRQLLPHALFKLDYGCLPLTTKVSSEAAYQEYWTSEFRPLKGTMTYAVIPSGLRYSVSLPIPQV